MKIHTKILFIEIQNYQLYHLLLNKLLPVDTLAPNRDFLFSSDAG
jgi:hypothetical protein